MERKKHLRKELSEMPCEVFSSALSSSVRRALAKGNWLFVSGAKVAQFHFSLHDFRNANITPAGKREHSYHYADLATEPPLTRHAQQRHPFMVKVGSSPDYSLCLSVVIWSSRHVTREFKLPRRLRQIKRHLRINICAMVTILQLLLFAHILYCWQIMLKKRTIGVS